MTIHQCRSCGQSVSRGEAVVRSEMFVQVAYCQQCWEDTVQVPQPRRPENAPRPATHATTRPARARTT